MIKKISSFIISFMIMFAPAMFISAAGLVPDCGADCNFKSLMTLINNVITFLLVDMATPLFVLIIIYVAWLYLSAGGSEDNHTRAKGIFKNAFIGYIIALCAWLIVKTILYTLGYKSTIFNGALFSN